MSRLPVVVFLLRLLVDAGCSGGASPGSPPLPQGPIPGSSTWQLISPDGGTITTADDVTVTVPAGALSTPTFVGVTSAPMVSSPVYLAVPKGAGRTTYGISVVGRRYELAPEGTTFAQPITITVPFDALPPGLSSTNVVLVADGAGGGPLPSTVVDQTHVSAQLSTASMIFPGVVTSVDMTCATAADCASSQRCVSNVCMGD